MRGKATVVVLVSTPKGITPAYAGKSGLRPKVERNDGDHPRLCGEKRFAPASSSLVRGSPPPMRGKD